MIISIIICVILIGVVIVQGSDIAAIKAKNKSQDGFINQKVGQTELKTLKNSILFSNSEELEKYKNSVIIIKYQLDSWSGMSGSASGVGFVVESGGQKYILSAYHILSGNGKISLEFAKKYLNAYIVSGEGKGRSLDWEATPGFDLVVLKLPGDLNYPAIPIGDSSELKVGQAAYVIGWPWGDEIAVRSGSVAIMKASSSMLNFVKEDGNSDLGEKDIMLMSFPTMGGDSGSPILAMDSDGKLSVIGMSKGSRGETVGVKIVPVFGIVIKINPLMNQAKILMRRL